MFKEFNIESVKDIRTLGVEGEKIIGEKLILFNFIIEIPLLIIGIFLLLYMLLVIDFPKKFSIILSIFSPQILAIIGLLAIVSGYTIYKTR